jgi:hypothetical protein
MPDEGGESACDAEEVLERRGGELLGVGGVAGYGVGRTPDGRDAIVVYLTDTAARAAIPPSLDGLPVLTVVIGSVQALS